MISLTTYYLTVTCSVACAGGDIAGIFEEEVWQPSDPVVLLFLFLGLLHLQQDIGEFLHTE